MSPITHMLRSHGAHFKESCHSAIPSSRARRVEVLREVCVVAAGGRSVSLMPWHARLESERALRGDLLIQVVRIVESHRCRTLVNDAAVFLCVHMHDGAVFACVYMNDVAVFLCVCMNDVACFCVYI